MQTLVHGVVTEADSLRGLLNLYKLDNFNYPSTQQGLEALVAPPQGEPGRR